MWLYEVIAATPSATVASKYGLFRTRGLKDICKFIARTTSRKGAEGWQKWPGHGCPSAVPIRLKCVATRAVWASQRQRQNIKSYQLKLMMVAADDDGGHQSTATVSSLAPATAPAAARSAFISACMMRCNIRASLECNTKRAPNSMAVVDVSRVC